MNYYEEKVKHISKVYKMKDKQKQVLFSFIHNMDSELKKYIFAQMFDEYSDIAQYIKSYETSYEVFDKVLDTVKMKDIMTWTYCEWYCMDNTKILLVDLYKKWCEREMQLWNISLDRFSEVNKYIEKIEAYEIISKGNPIDKAMTFINNEKGKLLTWYPAVDNVIWWLRPWTVTRIVAYSNTGKSRFMYSVMINLLREEKKIELFSLEVPVYICWINLCGAFYSVDTREIEEWKHNQKLKDFYAKYQSQIIVHDDVYSLPKLEDVCRKSESDIFFIDYVQNLEAWAKWEYENMTLVAKTIQKIAISTEKPIFDLSQTSNEGTRYKVWDVIPAKGSGALVHASDVIILIQRDMMPDVQFWVGKDISFIIAKNKFGENQLQIQASVDYAKCKFTIWN